MLYFGACRVFVEYIYLALLLNGCNFALIKLEKIKIFMKKSIFTILTVSLVALNGFAVDWTISSDDNLAKGAQVTMSSVREGNAVDITDEKDNTSASTETVNFNIPLDEGNQQHGETNWFLFDLGSSQQLNAVEIYWRDNHAASYKIYVQDSPFEMTSIEGTNGKTYYRLTTDVEALSPVGEGGNNDEAYQSAYVEFTRFEKAATGRYILVYCQPNNWAKAYGCGMFEFKATYMEGLEDISGLSLNNLDLIDGNKGEVTVQLVNAAGEVIGDFEAIQNLSLVCSDPEAADISNDGEGKFTVTANKIGTYTLTATATVKETGAEISGTAVLFISVNWEKTENIAGKASVTGRVKPETDVPNPATNATDGNEDTYYEFNGDYGGGDSWVVLDFGEDHVINAVEVLWGVGGGKYAVSYATEGATMPGENEGWTSGSKYAGWTSSETMSRPASGLTSYVFDIPVVARYIAVRDNDNPAGKPRIKEIYVAGQGFEETDAESMTLEVSDNYISENESVTVTPTVYDQNGLVMNVEGVKFFCGGNEVDASNMNGNVFTFKASEYGKGNFTITAQYDDVNAETVVYVIGSEDNSLNTAIEHKLFINGEESNLSLDGEINENDHGFGIGSTLEIRLTEKTANFDLIKLKWEAACPSDYTVVATYNDNSNGVIFTVSDRKFEGGVNPVDRIYRRVATRGGVSGQAANLDDIQSIKILPTAKDTGYGIRLLGVELYGAQTDNTVTSVGTVGVDENELINVYSIAGAVVKRNVSKSEATQGLQPGLYIVGKEKVVVR